MRVYPVTRWGPGLLGGALALGGGGCGFEPPPAPPALPVEAPAEAPPPPVLPPDAGAEPPPLTPPPEAPADAGSEADPYAHFPDVPAPACLPEPVRHLEATPCLLRELRPAGRLYSEAHRDAQGRLLELAHFDADGGVTRRVTSEYQGAHRVRRVEEDGIYLTTDTWEYDRRGRETRHVHRFRYPSVELEQVSETRYGAQGRTEEIRHWAEGRPDGRTGYEYDAQGLLVLIARADASGDVLAETRLTYHPNGHLRSLSYRPYATMGGETDEEYDARGLLVTRQWCTHKACSASTFLYDAAGRRTGEHHVPGGDLQGSTTVLTRYDAAGRRTVEQLHRDVGSYDPDEPRFVRDETRRFFYACGSGALVREELDVDGDAAAEGLHTLERDARGRLVREHFSGALLRDELEVREYRYDCAAGRN